MSKDLELFIFFILKAHALLVRTPEYRKCKKVTAAKDR